MSIDTFISVAANGNIRRVGTDHVSGTAEYFTVLELHRFLQDLADDQTASGDDLVDIVSTNPSLRSTDNIITLLSPYNIDDDLSEYLFNGSIIQSSGDTIYDGGVNFGNADQIIIHQNGVVLTNEYWNQASHKAATADSSQGISSRFLIKVRDGGVDIDGRRLLGLSRTFGNSYSEFKINGTSRGNNTLALSEVNDIFNNTAIGTVATWTDVTNTEGYQTIDLNNGNGAQPYYAQWSKGSRSTNEMYERHKWLSRKGTGSTLYGLSGELFRGITHEIPVDTGTGTFSAFEAVSWTGGTGQMLAIDSTTAPTTMWIQLLTGTAPTDNTLISGAGATCLVNGSVTQRDVSSPFTGTSTGTAILGSYGLGRVPTDLSVSDQITDLNGVAQTPPNLQTFSVTGLISGEDRVLVAPNNGSDEIQLNQFTANGAQSGSTLTINEAIPSDTPASGRVRVFNGNSYDSVEYTSYSGSVFTLSGALPNPIANGANVWVAYIDELASGTTAAFSALYSTDRSLVVKVRSGSTVGQEIVPFKTPATFGVGGGSVAAIRQEDV